MQRASSARVRFGTFELTLPTGELRNGNIKVVLQEQPLQILRMLIESEGELVPREEIKKKLWPNDTIVDFDHSINAAVKNLRRALGDNADEPKYIQTYPRRGYRLMVPVEWLEQLTVANSELSKPDGAVAVRTQPEAENLIGKKVSHYRVLGVLGGGGMGMVYKAEDLKLGRHVALKFLPADLASDPVALQRFEREARAASSLDHPNICTVYEVQEHDAQPFIVMQLLQGETLRDRLAALAAVQNKLPLNQLLDMAIQICEGLQAAHAKGIIHRDIKPANIFLTSSGQVKILDFGLAKLVEQAPAVSPANEDRELKGREFSRATAASAFEGSEAQPRLALNFASPENNDTGDDAPKGAPLPFRSSPDATLTRFGVALGTAGYMSPEQVRGEALDARTDIFSFGLVLYEMATGQRAFSGETAAVVENAILNAPPLPARELNPALPPRFVATIDMALEKDREQRYQSSAEMCVALKQLNTKSSRNVLTPWKWYAAAALLIAILTAGLLYLRSRTKIKLTDKDTIVVAHFGNTTGDTVMDDALDWPLDRKLEESPYLTVLNPSKVLDTLKLLNISNVLPMYDPSGAKLTPELARQVCLRSDSRAYVTASITNVGNYYHLTLDALDCHSARRLAKVERETNDRNQIVKTIGMAGHQLRRELGEPEDSLRRFNTPLELDTSWSLEALQAKDQGLRLRAEKGIVAALPAYKRAVELDPNLADAYLNLATIYRDSGTALGTSYATSAFNLRERLSQRSRWFTEAMYYTYTGELEKANATYVQWLQTFPADPALHRYFSSWLTTLGQHERAALEGREAVRLNPSIVTYNTLMAPLIHMNRLEEAKAVFEAARARGIDDLSLRDKRYRVAFLEHDRAGMHEQISWAMRDPETKEWALLHQGQNATYLGRFRAAGVFYSAARTPSPDSAPLRESFDDAAQLFILANTALGNVETGNPVLARRIAQKAFLAAPPDRFFRETLAVVLARSGGVGQAEELAKAINQEAPLNFVVQRYKLPTIRAAIELDKNRPARAIEILQSALPYELAIPLKFPKLYPDYLRGLSYLKLGKGREAAAEFQKIVEHPGIVGDCIVGPLSHLQLGRAQAMMGDKDAARKSYQDFLTLWKDADPDIPIYQQAKAEYAKLQ